MRVFDLPLQDVPIVVLDTETTGLYPGLGNRVVELAAVRLEKWQEVGRINYLVNPQRPMEARASEINGIRDADLLHAPTFGAITAELLPLLDGALLAAHNASFDADFLGLELWLAGHYDGSRPRDPVLPNPWLCTLQLARNFFHFGRNNLSHVAYKLGVRVQNAHRALNDVYITAEVLKRMARHLQKRRVVTVGDFLHAQGSAIFTPAPPHVPLPDLIGSALREGGDLQILYIGERGQEQRRITPRYAVRHQGTPFLIAYCHRERAPLPFQLDRIFGAALVDG